MGILHTYHKIHKLCICIHVQCIYSQGNVVNLIKSMLDVNIYIHVHVHGKYVYSTLALGK